MHARPLVPDGFAVPELLETDRLRLRPLTVHDLVRDYDAVMTSIERLRPVFGPGQDWPDGLTLEQDLLDLAWHQVEFQLRTSFAYTVVSLDERRVLGCVYLFPTQKRDHDVDVILWVRQSEAETGLDDHLAATVAAWIGSDWPFERPAYPGRGVPWSDWRDLPED